MRESDDFCVFIEGKIGLLVILGGDLNVVYVLKSPNFVTLFEFSKIHSLTPSNLQKHSSSQFQTKPSFVYVQHFAPSLLPKTPI